MRDREIVERVRDATDLLALVGSAVKLRKQGSAHAGLCPFHAERSPSFQVVANRGFYHCFGCGKHGDAFAWLMEREGMTFPEALEQLARAAGIDLPQRRTRPRPSLRPSSPATRAPGPTSATAATKVPSWPRPASAWPPMPGMRW